MFHPPEGEGAGNERWKLFGFLVADLFMVLALVFLIMTVRARADNARLSAMLQPTLTPSTTPTMSLSPTPLPRLELKPTVLELSVDWSGLLAGSASAQDSVIQQIQADSALQGRRAGLVIAYGGTADDSGIGQAELVASKVDAVLAMMSQPGDVFNGTAYHDPLFVLGTNYSYVKLEIYLFKVT